MKKRKRCFDFRSSLPSQKGNEGEDGWGLDRPFIFKKRKTDGIKGKNGTTAVTL